MRRVLVTGANGFVGRHLCDHLAAQGFAVRRAVRMPSSEQPDNTVRLDIADERADWRAALDGIEGVVHCAARVHQMRDRAIDRLAVHRAVNLAGTVRLAEAAVRAGVRRFVFLSTLKVMGEVKADGPYREDMPAHPVDPYAVSKFEAEEALRKIAAGSGLEQVVLRPPLVYGPGVRANFLRLMRLARSPFPLPLGGIDNRRSLVFVGNLVDAIRHCLQTPDAKGQRLLISDGAPVSTPELLSRLGEVMGRRPWLVSVPPSLLRGLGCVAGGGAIARLTESLWVEDRILRERLTWRQPFALQTGLERTVDWFNNQKAKQ